VIVVEQANPQVVYVPSYDPVVVYGPAVYPYHHLLSAGRILCGGARNLIWCGRDDGGILERRLGLGLWLGQQQTSTSTTTTISIVTRMLVVNRPSNQPVRGGGNRGNIGGGNAEEMPVGSTILNIAVALPIGTELLPTGSAALREEIPCQSQARARQQVGRRAAIYQQSRWGRSWRGQSFGGGGADRVGSRDLSRGGGGNRDAFGGGSRGSKGYNGSSARASGNAALPAWDLEWRCQSWRWWPRWRWPAQMTNADCRNES